MNKTIVVGKLGKDAELKVGENWKKLNFSVASDMGYKDKNGEWVTQTEWFNCSIWGNFVDKLVNVLKKGNTVYVEGKVKARAYTGSTGAQASLDLNVTEFKVIAWAKNDQSNIEDVQAEEIGNDDLPY